MGRSFREVAVHPVSVSTKFPSARALWESMERSMPPIVLMRRQLGEERWAPLSRAGEGAVTRVLGTGPVTLETHAWLTVGVAG